jgi:hypothetical protein
MLTKNFLSGSHFHFSEEDISKLEIEFLTITFLGS